MYSAPAADAEQNSPSDREPLLQKQSDVWLPSFFAVLATIFLFATIALGILYGLERNKTKAQQEILDNDLCSTPYCIKAAKYLLESINETIDPCENFYEFTCGTWIKNTIIPDDSQLQFSFAIVDARLKNAIVDLLSTSPPNNTKELKAIVNTRRLYDSCINEYAIETEGIDSTLSFINTQLGGWPILQGSTWDESTYNFSQLLFKLNNYHNYIIYTTATQIDDRNSSILGIQIGQSELGLQDRSYYTKETAVTIAYKDYMRDLAQALNNGASVDDIDVNAIFNFEKQIAKYHLTAHEQQAQESETIYTTLGNLTARINTTFNFSNHIRRLYAMANVTLIDSDIVAVSEVDFLRNASLIIDKQSPRTVQNYMIWRFMMNQVTYLPERFRNIKQTFNQVVKGTTSESTRTITCANYVNDNMGLAVSKLYINEYFDKNARSQSIEMIDNIRETFIDMIKQSTWMDSVSKRKAIEKARAINEKVGYPDHFDNENITKLDEDYAEYNFNSSFIQNAMLILRIKANADRQELRQPIDRTSWNSLSPTMINGFYSPSFNDISFPAGILQTPFFDKDAPRYLNYGAMGSIMGHEITHGFDDSGRQYDKDGNKILWWTKQTINAFDKQKSCFIDQYSNYTVVQADIKINGQQTQGEDIADNGGLKEAFLAYQKWSDSHKNVDKKLPGLAKYSPEQLFFLSFGHMWCAKMTDQYAKHQVLTNEHSPPQFRVLGSVSNFAEFDRAFGCKPGQGSSRVKKCNVW